jgi:hypothetical protein
MVPIAISHIFLTIVSISGIENERIKPRPGIDGLLACRWGERGSEPWRSTASAKSRSGAPGGAARPKQAVRASGSFCGARRARSASEW